MIATIDPDAFPPSYGAPSGRGLETARLALRPLELEDAGWISKYSSNPKVARQAARVPLPNPPLAAEQFIVTMRAAEPVRGDRVRAITLKSSGRPVGLMGLHPHEGARPEFGYWLGEPFWGNGYATEAGEAFLEAAAADGLGAPLAGHFEDNPASGRVLEKLGFSYTGEIETVFSMARMAPARCLRMARG